MKKLDLSNIETNVRGLILENEVIAHIESAYTEAFKAILQTLNCDPAEITILSGVEMTQLGQDYTVTAGWAAYQDEIFQIDADSFTADGGEIGVWVIETTYLATDPVKFDDGNEYNVNEIRKLKLQSGAAESGEKDWDDVILLVSDWIELTLEVESPPFTGQVFYRLNIDGTVSLKSVNLNLTGNAGSPMLLGTLPEIARPPFEVAIPVAGSQSGDWKVTVILIGTDGTINRLDTIGGGTELYTKLDLNHIRFSRT